MGKYKLNPFSLKLDYYEISSGLQNLSQVLTIGNSSGINNIDLTVNEQEII
jgi:hypothetical protein